MHVSREKGGLRFTTVFSSKNWPNNRKFRSKNYHCCYCYICVL